MSKTNLSARSKNETIGSAILCSQSNGNVDFKNFTIRHSSSFKKYNQNEKNQS